MTLPDLDLRALDYTMPASLGSVDVDPRKGIGPFVRMNFCVRCGAMPDEPYRPCRPWNEERYEIVTHLWEWRLDGQSS